MRSSLTYREIRHGKLVFDKQVYADFKERRENGRKKYAVMAIIGFSLLVIGSEGIYYAMCYMGGLLDVSPAVFEWIFDAAGLALILWAVMSAHAETRVIKNAEDMPKKNALRLLLERRENNE